MNPKTPSEQERREMLAAFLLAVLIDAGREGLETEEVAREAERDYDSDPERAEVVAALELLAEHDLALRDGERWRATRAALASRRFSF
jgi:hypothetical protein